LKRDGGDLQLLCEKHELLHPVDLWPLHANCE
jgi:hypothetical protein